MAHAVSPNYHMVRPLLISLVLIRADHLHLIGVFDCVIQESNSVGELVKLLKGKCVHSYT